MSAVDRLWLTGEAMPAAMAMKMKALDESAAFTATRLIQRPGEQADACYS